MNDHDTIQGLLDDHVDGLLTDTEEAAVRAHLATCAPCRAEVEAMLRLRAMVAELPAEIAPQRDLWEGIRARIEAAETAPATPRQMEVGRVIDVDFGRERLPRAGWGRGWLAAAAVVLIAVSSAVTATLVRSGGGPAPEVATGVAAAAPNTALVAFEPAEQEFLDTAGELKAALEGQRDQLDPETVRVVEQNLQIIEGAIREARAALEADPNNRNLTLMLADAHRKKIGLLRDAVQLSSL